MSVPDPRGRLASVLVLDTSVLVNFLRVDRVALLVGAADTILVTDHARSEITEDYPEQQERFQQAVNAGILQETSVSAESEWQAFVSMTADRALGTGECSTIAVAAARGVAYALDDRRARQAGAAAFPATPVFGTKDIMVAAIRRGVLTLQEADRIKREWEINHRFAMRFNSFADVL